MPPLASPEHPRAPRRHFRTPLRFSGCMRNTGRVRCPRELLAEAAPCRLQPLRPPFFQLAPCRHLPWPPHLPCGIPCQLLQAHPLLWSPRDHDSARQVRSARRHHCAPQLAQTALGHRPPLRASAPHAAWALRPAAHRPPPGPGSAPPARLQSSLGSSRRAGCRARWPSSATSRRADHTRRPARLERDFPCRRRSRLRVSDLRRRQHRPARATRPAQ